MNQWSNFKKGLVKDNPVFVMLLGMCPVLGVTTSALNGLGMGLATLFVLVLSNVVVSSVKRVIPEKVRIPCYIVIIASFVTLVDLLLAAYTPALHEKLGIYIPLIVVNCVILGRAESFASKNTLLSSIIDGLGMGIGFTMALTMLGASRELLGSGSLFDWPLMGEEPKTLLLFIMPPGAFITLGLLVAMMNRFREEK